MKKHLFMLMLAGAMLFTACGEKAEDKNTDAVEESADETTDEAADEATDSAQTEEDTTPVVEETVEDLGIEAFMTTGAYKGVEVSEEDVVMSDADVDTQISTNLSSNPLVYTDEETTVEMGDTVNLDYSGSIDGVKFEGGTAQGYDLVIGSGSFIDDFEDQLVGMHVGEEGEVEVTFPEEYQSADLAGKDAVFVCKINKISRASAVVTEEWLETYAEGKSEDEYRQSVKESMEKNVLTTTAWANFCATAQFHKFPQDRVDYFLGQLKASYEMYASMYGMEYDAFVEAMGMTEADVLTEAKNGVRNWMVLDYVCEKEGVTKDSDVYNEYLQKTLESAGASSVDEVLAQGVTEWDIDYTVKYNYVIELIADNAKVVPAK